MKKVVFLLAVGTLSMPGHATAQGRPSCGLDQFAECVTVGASRVQDVASAALRQAAVAGEDRVARRGWSADGDRRPDPG